MAKRKERIVVYEPRDLPDFLRVGLPKDAGPNGCLFFLYPKPNQAMSALWSEVAEPPIDHAKEGMAVAAGVLELFKRHPGITDPLFPKSVPEHERTKFGFGFHSAPAEQVRAFLADRAELVQLQDMLQKIHVLRADVPQLWVHAGRISFHWAEPAGPGVHTLDASAWTPGAAVALAGRGQSAFELTRSGQIHELDLKPHSAEGLGQWSHLLKIEVEGAAGRRPAEGVEVVRGDWPPPLHSLGDGVYFAHNVDPGQAGLRCGDMERAHEFTAEASFDEILFRED